MFFYTVRNYTAALLSHAGTAVAAVVLIPLAVVVLLTVAAWRLLVSPIRTTSRTVAADPLADILALSLEHEHAAQVRELAQDVHGQIPRIDRLESRMDIVLRAVMESDPDRDVDIMSCREAEDDTPDVAGTIKPAPHPSA